MLARRLDKLAFALSGWPFADDSGLTVEVLGGPPGYMSARYAGEPTDDQANNRKLLAAVADLPDDRQAAAFRCALALADPAGSIRLEGRGILPRTH